MQTQTPIDGAETLPLENTIGTRSHTHIVKMKKHKKRTMQHLVPTATNLEANSLRTQDEQTNKSHFVIYIVPIRASIQMNKIRN